MDLDEQFKQASEKIHSLNKRPPNDKLLELYGLYKQATEGDVKGERPGGFDFKAIAKYDTWVQFKGMSQDEAKKAYISLVNTMLA